MLTKFTHEQWEAEGTRRFGPDQMAWRFVCPVCGHIASVADYKAAGAPVGAVAFSCIGRYLPNPREAFGGKGPGPCNYTGGGLFGLNPVAIEGRASNVFAFADEQKAVA